MELDNELSSLTSEDFRSWHLNAAGLEVASRKWSEASVLIARNLERLGREGRVAPGYLERCRKLFEKGPDAMREGFLTLTEEGQVLRSIHPFAGLLKPEEREEILQRTRKRP